MCSFLETSPPSYHPLHTATFCSPIVKLTKEFAILTESGEVYIWGNSLPEQPPTPSDDDEEFDNALFEAAWLGTPIEIDRWPSRLPVALDYEPRKLPLPPIRRLSTGACNSICITGSGQLFIWGYKHDKWPEIRDTSDKYGTELREATIPAGSGDARLRVKDAAAGREHVVVLTEDGSLWSAGDGLYGQLGIGLRQFGLCSEGGVIDMLENYTEEEFAVDWQRMDMEALGGQKCEAVFADGENTLILTKDQCLRDSLRWNA
ncbi:hypothetical protein ASPWEDRAFT_531814 [Aspergillus wentii DTO 134E9]|uniref:RCC1/BLIP-II n=1 Tax=Aspergillus wentii DTO 134E9 TaxID=1073089 RepID=A0A1L9RLW7_ASPWE|nr:uncharacterized protein ASPWEDRAFT_531814 [Aspergillus wentii DTO 134E9]OJJ35883.1 hypothetical protein ASPWEDRAFT_531814 [Aspergillus wentii DTO 134E9]